MRNTRRKTVTLEYLNPDTEYDTSQFKYFMGIDPSFSSTGIVILDKDSNTPVEHFHVAAGTSKQPFSKRMDILLDKLNSCMLKYNTDDILVVMEGASFSSDFNCFKLGKLSGVLEYSLTKLGLTYNLVAPTFAKQVACGKGDADKAKVKLGVLQRWNWTSNCDDEVDAYVMAQIARGARPIPQPAKAKRKRKQVKDVE